MRIGLVLAAAGRGTRMGEGDLKQFAPLGGVPLLLRALRPFAAVPGLELTVVTLPPAHVERGGELLAGAPLPCAPVTCVAGGERRQDSVRAGLEALGDVDLVLVHDAARPLASAELVRRVVAAAVEARAGVVPALPVTDTLKRPGPGGLATVARGGLYAAQTPQAFPRGMLSDAHRRAVAEGVAGTDDAALCERLGYPVRLVVGEPANLKITTPGDWELAEALLAVGVRSAVPPEKDMEEEEDMEEREAAMRTASGVRTGIGYDVHRLEPGRRCIVGGVEIESDVGPVGHSDADVLVHAVMDALLGAAGEPDIGHRFPPEDPAWAGADSVALLELVRDAVTGRFDILYVDSFVVAEAPRLAPHVFAMRRRLAAALGIASERVNVKATTAEGLGALGRGEGIAAQAVATLRSRS